MKRLILFLLTTIGLFTSSCNNEAAETPSIELSHNTIEAWYNSEIYAVGVKSNCSWEATTDCEWITLINKEGSKGFNEIKFSPATNESSEYRTATITVYAKGYSNVVQTITVTQSILSEDYFKINYTSTDNDIVTPYSTAAFDAEIGQVIGPVKTQFGCHLIKVEAKNEAEVATLDEVKDAIRQNLIQQKQNQIYTETINDLKAKYMEK